MKRKKDKSKRGKRKGEREGRGKGRREGGRKKEVSYSDCCQLVVVRFQWPATVFLIFKALVSFEP